MATDQTNWQQTLFEQRQSVAAHYSNQLQIAHRTAQIERLEELAQRMSLELQRFAAVFEKENAKFDPPLPLDSVNKLLADWRMYISTRC